MHIYWKPLYNRYLSYTKYASIFKYADYVLSGLRMGTA